MIEIDTEDKSVNVNMNGKTVSNVSSISVYKEKYREYGEDEDEEYVSVSVGSNEMMDDVQKTTYYHCRGSEIVPKEDTAKAGDKEDEKYIQLFRTLFPGRV